MMSDLALHVFDQEGIDNEILVRRPYAIVGPSQDADVQISAEELKLPRHLYFQAVDEGILTVALSSHHRARQGSPAAAHLLGKRERLKYGPYRLGVERRIPHSKAIAHYTRDSSIRWLRRIRNQPDTSMCFKFINGHSRTGRVSTRYLRETLTLIGSSSRSHLKLSHPEVQDFHSSIVRTGDEIWILALSSQCMLRVNGRRVRHVQLASGDVVSVGPFHMQLQISQRRDSHPVVIPGETAVQRISQDDASGDTPASRTSPNSSLGSLMNTSQPTTDEIPGGNLISQRSDNSDSELSEDMSRSVIPGLSRSRVQNSISCSTNTELVQLLEQLTGLQQILIEQSQLQTSLMIQLAGDMQAKQRKETSERNLLQEQIAAIQRIADELQAWRSESDVRGGSPAHPPSQVAPGPSTSHLLQNGPVNAGALPQYPREPKSQEDIEAHSSLSSRIEVLQKERNSIIKRVLKLLPSARDISS